MKCQEERIKKKLKALKIMIREYINERKIVIWEIWMVILICWGKNKSEYWNVIEFINEAGMENLNEKLSEECVAYFASGQESTIDYMLVNEEISEIELWR